MSQESDAQALVDALRIIGTRLNLDDDNLLTYLERPEWLSRLTAAAAAVAAMDELRPSKAVQLRTQRLKSAGQVLEASHDAQTVLGAVSALLRESASSRKSIVDRLNEDV